MMSDIEPSSKEIGKLYNINFPSSTSNNIIVQTEQKYGIEVSAYIMKHCITLDGIHWPCHTFAQKH